MVHNGQYGDKMLQCNCDELCEAMVRNGSTITLGNDGSTLVCHELIMFFLFIAMGYGLSAYG